MRHVAAALALATGFLMVSGCDSPTRVAGPQSSQLLSREGSNGDGQEGSNEGSDDKTDRVQMLDDCDPATFNAAIGPGTCLSSHPGTTFAKFLDQLTKKQQAPAWRFAPHHFTVNLGTAIIATNRGGEVHTFTRVAAFGGGVVPFLNQLSGTPIPAPECLAAPPSEYIPPGGFDTDIADTHGTINYECCIHPWMRATVRVR